jgi:hypothetical protein
LLNPEVLDTILTAPGAAIDTVGTEVYPPMLEFTVTAVTLPSVTVEFARAVDVPPVVLATVTTALAP